MQVLCLCLALSGQLQHALPQAHEPDLPAAPSSVHSWPFPSFPPSCSLYLTLPFSQLLTVLGPSSLVRPVTWVEQPRLGPISPEALITLGILVRVHTHTNTHWLVALGLLTASS